MDTTPWTSAIIAAVMPSWPCFTRQAGYGLRDQTRLFNLRDLASTGELMHSAELTA